jgi:predicted amidophosphoribosyltransferase
MEVDAFIVVVIAVVFAFVIAILALQSGQRARRNGQRSCPGCGADNPAIAKHCRRCGKAF